MRTETAFVTRKDRLINSSAAARHISCKRSGDKGKSAIMLGPMRETRRCSRPVRSPTKEDKLFLGEGVVFIVRVYFGNPGKVMQRFPNAELKVIVRTQNAKTLTWRMWRWRLEYGVLGFQEIGGYSKS